MSTKITPKNIFYFFQGNLRMLGDHINLIPKHQREQVLYRSKICTDCIERSQCAYCGCGVPGKLYVSVSCNHGERFPNMMDEKEWEDYKVLKNIEIREDDTR